MSPVRHQTSTERDISGLEAKRKREADQLAIPHEVDDPVTGQYEGPELDVKREERDPLERIRHLEKKNDELLARLLDMSATTFNTKIEIGKSSAADDLAARRSRRELIAKTLLYVLGIIGAMLAGKAL